MRLILIVFGVVLMATFFRPMLNKTTEYLFRSPVSFALFVSAGLVVIYLIVFLKSRILKINLSEILANWAAV